VWTDGVFQASRSSIYALEQAAQSADFAVLVLSPDDTVVSRGSERTAPRDNVVFELGLFIGALGHERTFIVRPRGVELKVPTDLLGVTPLDYQPGCADDLPSLLGPTCNALRQVISHLRSK
jgi:predicted nucleotide-binding protein